jgi:hypothetical protein
MLADRRRAAVAIGSLAAILALVNFALFTGQVAFFRDLNRWVFPARAFVERTLRAGELPTWNPAEGLGLPVSASPLYGIFYPPYALALLGSPARAVSWLWFLQLVSGGVGLALLARRFDVRWTAALIGALCWSLAGFTSSAWMAGVMLPAASYLPWIALGCVALARRAGEDVRSRARGVALAALPIALSLLVGEVFFTTMSVIFGVACALLWRASSPSPPPLRRTGAALAAAVVLAGLLAAVLLLPLLAGSAGTARAGPLPRAVAEHWSLHPLRLLELVAPGAMGDPFGAYPGGPWAGDGNVDERPLLYSVYLGTSALALAALAFGRGRRLAVGLAAIAVLALITALGRHTPVHQLVRYAIPVLSLQRSPEKYLLLCVASTALLAALGAERILADPRPFWRRSLILAALIAGLALVPLLRPDELGRAIGAAGRHAAVVAILLLALLSLAARFPRAAPLALVALVAADLGRASLAVLPFAPPSLLDEPPALATEALARRASPAPPRVFRAPEVEQAVAGFVPRGDAARLERAQIGSLRQSTLTAHGLATLPPYDAARPPLLERLWARARAEPLALMRVLAVEYVVLPRGGPEAPAVPGLTLVAHGPPGSALYRVNDPLPRASVVGEARIATDEQALEELLSPDVVAGRSLLLAPGTLAKPIHGAGGDCALVRFSATALEARCRAPAAAYVLFVEQFAPGWTATVDGQPAPVLRANLFDRAVPVAAGAHTITLRYRMPGAAAGATLSLLAAILFAAALVLSRRR